MVGTCQAFIEQRIEQAEQQRRIFTRADEHMLIGNSGGFTTARIDYHQLAAARLHGLEALFYVWDGHDAAIGGQRIAAKDQHEIGMVDVWNRD